MIIEHARALSQRQNKVKIGLGNAGGTARLETRQRLKTNVIGKDPFRSDPAQNRRVGYIRVSTMAQITDRQTATLEGQCDELHVEHISGAAKKRPVFDRILSELQFGETLVVSDLDRAFRSSIDAMLVAQDLRERGVHFHILRLHLDTATEEGELFYTMLAGFAQYERRIIARRTREGLAAARRRGSKLGRPAKLDPKITRAAHAWIQETGLPCAYVATFLAVSRVTLQRAFHREGLAFPIPPSPKGALP
jgi:DNA invertase Pin-like site-specific DNA recombinase